MKKRFALLTAVALLGIGSASPAAAQAYERVAQEETDGGGDEDGGSDKGWIGLLGLAGLAGLLGRNRRDDNRR